MATSTPITSNNRFPLSPLAYSAGRNRNSLSSSYSMADRQRDTSPRKSQAHPGVASRAVHPQGFTSFTKDYIPHNPSFPQNREPVFEKPACPSPAPAHSTAQEYQRSSDISLTTPHTPLLRLNELAISATHSIAEDIDAVESNGQLHHAHEEERQLEYMFRASCRLDLGSESQRSPTRPASPSKFQHSSSSADERKHRAQKPVQYISFQVPAASSIAAIGAFTLSKHVKDQLRYMVNHPNETPSTTMLVVLKLAFIDSFRSRMDKTQQGNWSRQAETSDIVMYWQDGHFFLCINYEQALRETDADESKSSDAAICKDWVKRFVEDSSLCRDSAEVVSLTVRREKVTRH
ncbi:hypothetical protein EMMF5_004070 [Cystobasidiomycetes sp. EMM_F5]